MTTMQDATETEEERNVRLGGEPGQSEDAARCAFCHRELPAGTVGRICEECAAKDDAGLLFKIHHGPTGQKWSGREMSASIACARAGGAHGGEPWKVEDCDILVSDILVNTEDLSFGGPWRRPRGAEWGAGGEPEDGGKTLMQVFTQARGKETTVRAEDLSEEELLSEPCPVCYAKRRDWCVTPKGGRAKKLHKERIAQSLEAARYERAGRERDTGALAAQQQISPGPGNEEVRYVPLGNLRANPYQIEGRDDPDKLMELAASIREHGMLETPVGRDAGDGVVELGSGHRRLAAMTLLWQEQGGAAGWDTMRVRVMALSDEAMANIVIQENAKREDLNPIAEARFYRRYLEAFGVTQTQLAERVGFSQAEISNTLRLLDLPEDVQQMVMDGRLTSRHGRELLKIKAVPDLCSKMAGEAVDQGYGVGQLAERIMRELDWGHGFKHVDKRGYGMDQPVFDTTGCRRCEHRIEYEWGSQVSGVKSEKRAVCINPECWKKLQAAAEAKTREARQAEIDKMVAGLQEKAPAPQPEEVGKKKAPKLGTVAVDTPSAQITKCLDLDKVRYDDWERLDKYTLQQIANPGECETCPKRVLGAYGGRVTQAPDYVCLDPACFRKKRSAKTRATNKAVREDAAQRNQVINDGLAYLLDSAYGFMADRDFLLAVLELVVNHNQRRDSTLAKDYGLEPADRWTRHPRVTVEEWFAGKSELELAWIIVREVMLGAGVARQMVLAARLCGKAGLEVPTVTCSRCGEEKRLDHGVHIHPVSYGQTEPPKVTCYACVQKEQEERAATTKRAEEKEARGEELTDEEEDALLDADENGELPSEEELLAGVDDEEPGEPAGDISREIEGSAS